MAKRILILFLISLGNFWIWSIFSTNIWIGLSLLIETILFYLIINRFDTKLFLLFASIYILLITYLYITGFDTEIWKDNRTEALTIRQRFEYLATDLGKIYKNRFAIYYHNDINPRLDKIQKNIFSNLDINLYFFASHPRERVGINEFNKYPSILWPFFLFGIYLSFKKSKKIFFLYLFISLFASGFISQTIILGPILFFPWINVILMNGFVHTLNFLQENKLKNVKI